MRQIPKEWEKFTVTRQAETHKFSIKVRGAPYDPFEENCYYPSILIFLFYELYR